MLTGKRSPNIKPILAPTKMQRLSKLIVRGELSHVPGGKKNISSINCTQDTREQPISLELVFVNRGHSVTDFTSAADRFR